MYPSSTSSFPFRGLVAFLGLLPAPGGTEGHGGTSAASATTTDHLQDPRRVAGLFSFHRRSSATDRTIAKGDPATRRSHVPNDGTAEAAAIERARKGMLHEGRELKRRRIRAGALCEALLRQG